MLENVGAADFAFAFRRATAAERDQTRQPAVSGAVLRKGEQAHAVDQIEPRADQQAKALLLRGDMHAYHAGQAVAVGHGDRGMAQGGGLRHQFVRMRGAAQEAEFVVT